MFSPTFQKEKNFTNSGAKLAESERYFILNKIFNRIQV